MKNVLIVAYYFPPSGGPGVQRVLKYCKYLYELGWRPIVLTVLDGDYPARDESLLKEIPEYVKVYRSKIFEPYSLYRKLTGKKPNTSVVEDVLGCKFVMSAETEKEGFFTVLQDTIGDDFGFDMIGAINEKLEEILEENKNETEVPTIGSNDIKEILMEIGVKEKDVAPLTEIYSQNIGENRLTVSNLVDSKTVVSLPDITVNIKNSARDKFKTAVIGGRTVLIIDLDDPYVEINGLSTKIAEIKEEMTV